MAQHIIDFSTITVDSLQKLYDEYVLFATKLNDHIGLMADSKLTWDELFEKTSKLEDEYAQKLVLLDVEQLHPLAEVRQKCSELNKELSKFSIDQGMRKDVYMSYDKYYKNNYLTEDLTTEQKKYVEKTMIGFRMIGLQLDEETSVKTTELSKKISSNAIDYNQNLQNIKTELFLTATDLQGMDEVWLENRKQADAGTFIVKLQYPDYIPIMEFCANRSTRRMMYIAMNSRCIDTNVDICLNTLALRKEKALLFGFSSHADYKLQNQMAKNYANVMDFLNNLKEQIIPLAKYDINILTSLAKELDDIDKLEVWDTTYYSRIHTERVSSLNMRDLQDLFSIESVTNGIFSIYQQILGVKFTDITSDYSATLFNSDVKMFSVQDSNSNELMGHFYLDLYPREGKYGHAAVFPMIRKSKFNLPLAAIVCNFDPKSNVTFDNVVTYFHEFGHLMHNMCSTNTISGLAGTSVERDFVETPSQMFEEWVSTIEPLRMLVIESKKELVTEELVKKINVQNKTLQGIFYARQLSFALYDMQLHSDVITPSDFYSTLYYELVGLDVPSETNVLGAFSHIISGYDSGYYGYLWSKVFAIDLFSIFKNNVLDPELGLQLRNKILSQGGTKTGYELLKDFLGREPNANAFISSLESL